MESCWGEEQEREAQEAVARAAAARLDPEAAEVLEQRAAEFWDKFYSIHQNRFFKERNWLFTEFPDLAPGQLVGRERVFGSTGERQQEEGDVNVHEGEVPVLQEERVELGEKVAKLR